VLFLILAVCLLFGGLVTLVAALNLAQPIHLDLFSWHTPDLPIGVWLVAAFLFGAVALYLVSVLSALGDRRKMKALRQQVIALQEKVTTMSQPTSVPTEPKAGDSLSAAMTGPLMPMPGVKSPQTTRRIQLSPLSSMQDSRQ
jgi:uncharacterized integral membrane protein